MYHCAVQGISYTESIIPLLNLSISKNKELYWVGKTLTKSFQLPLIQHLEHTSLSLDLSPFIKSSPLSAIELDHFLRLLSIINTTQSLHSNPTATILFIIRSNPSTLLPSPLVLDFLLQCKMYYPKHLLLTALKYLSSSDRNSYLLTIGLICKSSHLSSEDK